MAGGGARRTNAVKGTASCKANQAKPCDVATLKISVTDAEKHVYDFSTDRRLRLEQVAKATPAHVMSALRSTEFYVEVLGSSGAVGLESKQAKVSVAATYVGGCGKVEHTRPVFIDPETSLVTPARGVIALKGPPDGTVLRDARSTARSSSNTYTLVASACGRPLNLRQAKRGALSATVAVFTPQDWEIKLSSPSGFEFGYERERGVKSVDKTESSKWWGKTGSSNERTRGADGDLEIKSTTVSNRIEDQQKITIKQGENGRSSSVERTISQRGGLPFTDGPKGSDGDRKQPFFSKRSISEKIGREGDGPYVKSDLEDETEFDARGFKLEILRDGKPAFDTEDMTEDIEKVLEALKELMDVLKGLPKAGYWIEGKASFLALSGVFAWKRVAQAHRGPRHVCIGSKWKMEIEGTVFEAELTVGAGLKLKALGSFYGGVEVYAYLEGSLSISLSAKAKFAGTMEPDPRNPEAPIEGKIEFEGKLRGKASALGQGWEYQRSASVEGKAEATPQLIDGGIRLGIELELGRWRYKVTETDDWGVPRTYEIDDLWALRPGRLSEKDIQDKEDNPSWERKGDLIFRTSKPYLDWVNA